MLTHLAHFWSRLMTSRYTRALEDENARLRAENRALINSILGIAGIPPLRLDAEIERERSAATRVTRRGAPHAFHAEPSSGGDAVAGDSTANQRKTSLPASANLSESGEAPSARGRGMILPISPLRRRSWQQVGRMLEIEEVRRRANRDNSDSMS